MLHFPCTFSDPEPSEHFRFQTLPTDVQFTCILPASRISHLRSISQRLRISHYPTTSTIKPLHSVIFETHFVYSALHQRLLRLGRPAFLGRFFIIFSIRPLRLVADGGSCGVYGDICFFKNYFVLFSMDPARLVVDVLSSWLCYDLGTRFGTELGRFVATSLFVFIRQPDWDWDIPEELFLWVCGGTNGRGMTRTWRRHNESITSPSRWSCIPALSI